MVDSRAASRYAKSLLGLAIEQNSVEQVSEDMKLFTKVVEQNKSFELMLHNPIIRHDKKRDILEKLFKGKVSALTLSIFDIITRKNREPLLASIAREIQNQYNEYKGIGKATITTATALDAKLRAEFEKMVKELSHKKTVELAEKVDASLIGGFVLNVGDRQIDASIKSKLKSLKVEFSQNPYIKEF